MSEETMVDEPVADVAEVEVEEAAESDADAAPAGRSKREAALENEGEIAADYLEELLDIADLDGDIDTFNEGGRAHVSIITDSDERALSFLRAMVIMSAFGLPMM